MQRGVATEIRDNAFEGRTGICPECGKRVQVRSQRDNLVTHTTPRKRDGAGAAPSVPSDHVSRARPPKPTQGRML